MLAPVLPPGDLSSLTDDELVELFREMEVQRRRREVMVASVVGEVERRGMHLDDGHLSVEAWCRSTARWSPAEARAVHRVARLLRNWPQVIAAREDRGGVPVAHLHEMARAAANPRCGSELGGVLPILLTEVGRLEFADFRTVVRRWEWLADADGAHRDAEETHERRRATAVEHDGVVTVSATLGALQGAVVMEIFRRFSDAEFQSDWHAATEVCGDGVRPADLARTAAQRRADALVAVFEQAASTPHDARRPLPLVNIVVDWDTFSDELARRQPTTAPADDAGDRPDASPTSTSRPTRAGADAGAGAPTASRSDGGPDAHDEPTSRSRPTPTGTDGDARTAPDRAGSGARRADTDAATERDLSGGNPTRRGQSGVLDPRSRRCETSAGSFIPPADAVDAAILGHVRRIVFDRRGVLVNAGFRSRLFRGALREALMAASSRCPASGCLVHAGRQADHLTPWSERGPTDAANGATPCGHHNRLKNRGFRIERDDTGHWHTYRPDGTEIGAGD